MIRIKQLLLKDLVKILHLNHVK